MEGIRELSHELRIFEHIRNAVKEPLRRVDIAHGRISVSHASEGEFLMWEREHNGGFCRLYFDVEQWTKGDHQKLERLLRGPTTFYVRLYEDHAKVFPQS